jgi:sodium/proline symporter
MSDQTIIAAGFVLYMVAIAGLGVAAYRRTRDVSSFILGDRRLSYWVTALSAGASDMSGWLLLGLPGLAYVSLDESAWVAAGLFAGTYLNWLFIARPLREQSVSYGNALTIPEFFERRFKDDSHVLRSLSALCLLAFFVVYTSAGFVAGGKLFEASFGLPYTTAVLLGTVLVVAYTSFGGFLAVAWTDALQATLMFFALLTVAVVAFLHGGDIDTVSSPRGAAARAAVGSPVTATVIVSALAWGLGYVGQPHILARFMAIRDGAQLGAARRLATAWTGIALCAAIAVGVSGHWALDSQLVPNDSEKVFIYLIHVLLHPAVAGVCLAAILAAIMSTADSQLLVAAAALTHDLLPAAGRDPRAAALRWHRGAVVLICVLAAVLAMNPEAMVLDMVAYAWAGFGATIGPCVIMSLYSPNTGRWSALAGIVLGALTVVVWERLDGGIFDIYALLPGFIGGMAAIALGNKLGLGTGSG